MTIPGYSIIHMGDQDGEFGESELVWPQVDFYFMLFNSVKVYAKPYFSPYVLLPFSFIAAFKTRMNSFPVAGRGANEKLLSRGGIESSSPPTSLNLEVEASCLISQSPKTSNVFWSKSTT